jgi:hypothetical protein
MTGRLQDVRRRVFFALLLGLGRLSGNVEAAEPSMPRAASAPAAPRAGDVTTPFLIAVVDVLERARLNENPQLPAIEAVLARGEELERELDRHAGAVPADYGSELRDMTRQVQSLDLKASDDAAARTLALLERDLRIKTRYLQAGAGGFAFQKALQVMVHVITRQGPGYVVSFNPLRFVGTGSARFPVASMTNNAKRLLPPGLYVMTLERGGRSTSQEIEIGESGAEEQLIEVGP